MHFLVCVEILTGFWRFFIPREMIIEPKRCKIELSRGADRTFRLFLISPWCHHCSQRAKNIPLRTKPMTVWMACFCKWKDTFYLERRFVFKIFNADLQRVINLKKKSTLRNDFVLFSNRITNAFLMRSLLKRGGVKLLSKLNYCTTT